MDRMSRRRTLLGIVAVLSMTGALLPATAAQGDTVLDARDTASSAPPATVDRPVPGAVPVTGAATKSLTAAAEPGQTTSYYDQSGIKTYRVDDGHDLDQYLFSPSNPLNAAITHDTYGGPVYADGTPAPGNTYYTGTGRLTLRVWDVDDDYPGTDVAREIDTVAINGYQLTGALSGADSQWSTATFEVPLSVLRFPATDGGTATQDITVNIDTGNPGNPVWAVQVDWVELRLGDATLPLVIAHGITDTGEGVKDLNKFFTDHAPALTDKIIVPPMTFNGSIQANSASLVQPVADLVLTTGAPQVNVVSHSMGGLDTRLYAWDHPGQVRKLTMIATPNGGSFLADVLCASRSIPFWERLISPITSVPDALSQQFGKCEGPENGLFQLQQWYIKDVFNKQVLDSHNVDYTTIAGQGNALGNGMLLGEDDGAVSVDSVRWLRPDTFADPNPDHPGLHDALTPAYERDHAGLVTVGSPAIPRSLCTLYPTLYRCDSTLYTDGAAPFRVGTAAATVATTTEMSTGGSITVGPRSTASTTLTIEPTTKAAIVAIPSSANVTVTAAGAAMTTGTLFNVPAQFATLTSGGPVTVTVTNPTDKDVVVPLLATVSTTRHLTVTGPTSLTRPNEPVAFQTTLSDPSAGDQVNYQVRDTQGTVVTSGVATPDTAGAWAFTASAASGQYTVLAWVEGPSARAASTGWTVGSATDSIVDGSLTDTAVDTSGDGLFDTLDLGLNVTVAEAGKYRLSVRLRAGDGREVATAGTAKDLPAGTSTVPLSIAGHDIFASDINGPYTVTDVTLSRADTMVLLDARSPVGTTGNYDHTRFSHFPVEFDLAAFTDQGVDVDGDQLFEALNVGGSVHVDEAGPYAVNARLVDASGRHLTEFATTVSMTAGTNPLTLTFAGEPIGKSGVNGPYRVVDLSVYSLWSPDVAGYLPTAHLTSSYLADDFIGGVLTFNGVRQMMAAAKAAGTLDAGTYTSLLAKLDAADASIQRGNTKAADNQLDALLNELSALSSSNISEATRASLTQAVTRLRPRA